MKYIKFSYHLLCKYFAMSLLVIIQLAVSFSLLQGMISYTADRYSTVIAFEPLSRANGLHFSTELSQLPESVFEDLQKNYNIDIATSISYSNFGIDVTFYDPCIIQHYKPNLTSGVWFSEHDFKSNTDNIPVVAFGEHNVGEIIYSGTDGIYYEVIGVSNDNYYFSFNSYGYETDTNMVMQPTNTDLFLSVITDFSSDNLEWFSSTVPNVYVLFANNTDSLEMASKKLSEYGYINSFKDILEYGKASSYEMLRVLLPFFIFMYAVSIVGMIGCVALTIVKHLKMFSVMYIVGATRKTCVCIVLLYVIYLLIGALLIFRLISSFLFTRQADCYTVLSLLCSMGFCLVVLCAACIPITILKQNQPLKVFKKNK